MILGIVLSRKAILQYSLLPQIVPRFRELFGSGFAMIAYFIALVYGAVRLLPAGHPYMQRRNLGRFGLRDVIAQAANRLEVRWENIDKIIIFFLVLLGLVIVFAQVIILAGGLFMQSAIASTVVSEFSVANDLKQVGYFGLSAEAAKHDLAYMFMDLVFGVQGVFNSCVSIGAGKEDADVCMDMNGVAWDAFSQANSHAFPYPIHKALHAMLLFYSQGLLIVAFLITLYFVVTVLAETAQTGTPFGKRYNKVWAPLRIVAAFALLIPLGSGLSAAQYIVLHMAKFGSNFATHGWNTFNETLVKERVDSYEKLVATPKMPMLGDLLRFYFVANTCMRTTELRLKAEGDTQARPQAGLIKPYLVRSTMFKPHHILIQDKDGVHSPPYFVQDAKDEAMGLINFANGADHVKIVFGYYDPNRDDHDGRVVPYCGAIKFPISDPRTPLPPSALQDPETIKTLNDAAPDEKRTVYAEPGIDALQRFHWLFLKNILLTSRIEMGAPSVVRELPDYVGRLCRTTHVNANGATEEVGAICRDPLDSDTQSDILLKGKDIKDAVDYHKSILHALIDTDCTKANGDKACDALNYYRTNTEVELSSYSAKKLHELSNSWTKNKHLRHKGWAAASIWYNKIAEMNGAFTEAVLKMPEIEHYPLVMEEILVYKSEHEPNIDVKERFKPSLKGNQAFVFNNSVTGALNEPGVLANTLYQAYKVYDGIDTIESYKSTGNAFYDIIKAIFGTEGLYNMQRNHDVHPLAQIVGVGKSLIESSFRNVGYSALGKGGSPLIKQLLGKNLGVAAETVTGFLMSVTMVAITLGFMLYYLMPFLPFIYFFFAVAGWVKGIFEAMVAVPLWALAHIRIDGQGLPGQAAMSGYFLIFEIFLRPILTVFGLLASISIFSALVAVLGDVWIMVAGDSQSFDVFQDMRGLQDMVREGGDENGNAADMLEKISGMGNMIDEFFYMIVYTMIVYMVGMSSFKLIDLIPNMILRWMGQNVQAFNDSRDNPAQKALGSTYTGVSQLSSKLGNALGGRGSGKLEG